MSLSVTVDVSGADNLRRAARNFKPAVQAGIRNAAFAADREVARDIRGIYSEPIPTAAQERAYRGGQKFRRSPRSGRKLWKRTHALEKGRVVQFSQWVALVTIQGRAAQTITSYPAGYAQKREALGRLWTPKRPALGRVRSRWFMFNAAKRIAPRVGNLVKQGFERRMNR
jgi:hypothetical protein